jgi:hypothetical protein
MNMKNIITATLLLLSLCLPCFAEPISSPEQVAKAYMLAFFRGDIESASELMHPEALGEMKAALVNGSEAAGREGKAKDFLAQFGFASEEEFRSASDRGVFVTVVTNSRRSNPAANAAMKTAQVEIKGSQKIDDLKVSVELSIGTPSSSGLSEQSSKVVMKRSEDEWKVLSTH